MTSIKILRLIAYGVLGYVVGSVFGSFVARAEEVPSRVKLLEEGNVAPYTGYLFSFEKEREARVAVETVKIQDNIIKQYKSNEEIFERRISNLSEQNDNLAKRNEALQSTSTWERIGWVTLGVVITGLGVYGSSQVLKAATK